MQRILSFALRGIDALPVEVECDERPASGGKDDKTPKISVVGLPDASVRESAHRVRAALCNCQFPIPRGPCTVNLAPAELRKEGPVYDLPIAIAMLRMQGVIGERADERLAQFALAGELALDGMVRPIRGATSFAAFARDHKLRGIIVPIENAPEAAVIEGLEVYGVTRLEEAVGFFNGFFELRREPPPAECPAPFGAATDFAEVRGQEAAKRALALAAAGGHNALLIGIFHAAPYGAPAALHRLLDLAGDLDLRVHQSQGIGFHLKSYMFLEDDDGAGTPRNTPTAIC